MPELPPHSLIRSLTAPLLSSVFLAASLAATGCQSCGNGACTPRWYCDGGKFSAWCDDLQVQHTAKRCARKALHQMRDQCRESLSDDFEDGFEAAFVDIAFGRPGTPPPVPPMKYWQAFYRSPQGRSYADQWFEGYRLGADVANESGLRSFQRIDTPHQLAACEIAAPAHGVLPTPVEPLEDPVSTPPLPAPAEPLHAPPPAPPAITSLDGGGHAPTALSDLGAE